MRRQTVLVLAMVFLFTISPSTFGGMIKAWGWDYFGQVSNTPTGNDFTMVYAGESLNVARMGEYKRCRV